VSFACSFSEAFLHPLGDIFLLLAPICSSLGLVSSRGRELLDLIRDTANFFAFLRTDLQAHPEKYAMTKCPKRDLRGPYPTALRDVQEELDYWASRQNEGLPGTTWEEGVKNRIEHLVRLERRLKEEMEHIEPRPGWRGTTSPHGFLEPVCCCSSWPWWFGTRKISNRPRSA